MSMTMCFVSVYAEGSPSSSPCRSLDAAGLMALLDDAPAADIRSAAMAARHGSDMLPEPRRD